MTMCNVDVVRMMMAAAVPCRGPELAKLLTRQVHPSQPLHQCWVPH